MPRSATSGPEADPAAERDAAAGRAWRRPRRPTRPGRHPAHPQPANLLADQVQSPDRFYAISGRDFTAVFAR